MLRKLYLPAVFLITLVLLAASCNNTQPAKEDAKPRVTTTSSDTVTNPLFTIAPVEFAQLSEKALLHLAAFEFDAWGVILADTVVYSFPDGDAANRTTLKGKTAVLGWWKTWKDSSGVQSMSMTAFNHVPINVISQPQGGFPAGIYDLVYFDTKLSFNNKPVGLRMNFSVHFNADKKIDHYATYYDGTVIIKAMGKDISRDSSKTK